ILLQSFRWTEVSDGVQDMLSSLAERNIDNKEGAELFFNQLFAQIKQQEAVAHKFVGQLYQMLADTDAVDYEKICTRTQSAVQWFLPKMEMELIDSTTLHIEEWKVRKRTKKYIQEVKALLLDFKRKYETLKHCLTIAQALTKEDGLDEVVLHVDKIKDEGVEDAPPQQEGK